MSKRANTSNRRQGRRWRFGSAVLDERSWTLHVGGCVVPIEAKPLELLHELLLHAGEPVGKEQLLAAVWPGISVVDASLATAILKVRRALGDEGAAAIQTVPRIGYKLAVPVALEAPEATTTPTPEPVVLAQQAVPPPSPDPPTPATRPWRWPSRAAGATLAALALVLALQPLRQNATASAGAPTVDRQGDARDALRSLDLPRVEGLLRAGWNPNTAFDSEGNAALHVVVQVCEWHPAHDPQKLVLVVKTLLDAQARPETRNVWGDTAYSIARAKRYCGTAHPVSHLLHVTCFAGHAPVGDKCLPSYAGAATSQQRP